MSRDSVIDYGVTCDPWQRFRGRVSRHQYDEDKVGMLIVMKCTDLNLAAPIRTPHTFGRVVERMIASYDFKNAVPTAYAGEGSAEDPNNEKLAKSMIEFREVIGLLLDQALERGNFVTSKVSFLNYLFLKTETKIHLQSTLPLNCLLKN